MDFPTPDVILDCTNMANVSAVNHARQHLDDDYTGWVKIIKRQSFVFVRLENGGLHRILGPAMIWRLGRFEYYLNDRYYSFKDYWKAMYELYKGTDQETLCLANMLGE